MNKKTNFNNLVKQSRKLAFPGMTLCLIEFNDETNTNDFIPNEVLENPNQDNAAWWNEENKDDYLPLIEGRKKAVKAMPIVEN